MTAAELSGVWRSIPKDQQVAGEQGSALQMDCRWVRIFLFTTRSLSRLHCPSQAVMARLDGSGIPAQVSMNEMMETIETFDEKNLPIRHIPGPEGVRGRNSDNALILEKLGWEPTIRLADGLKVTYFWIKSQLAEVRQLLISHSG